MLRAEDAPVGALALARRRLGSFRQLPAARMREAGGIEWPEVVARLVVGDELGDEAAGDRCQRDAFHRVAGRNDEPVDPSDRGQPIGQAGTEASPAVEYRPAAHAAEPALAAAVERLEPARVDREVEADQLKGGSKRRSAQCRTPGRQRTVAVTEPVGTARVSLGGGHELHVRRRGCIDVRTPLHLDSAK